MTILSTKKSVITLLLFFTIISVLEYFGRKTENDDGSNIEIELVKSGNDSIELRLPDKIKEAESSSISK